MKAIQFIADDHITLVGLVIVVICFILASLVLGYFHAKGKVFMA